MKFLLIIIALFICYSIIKSISKSKEKTNNIDNMILCKKCGFHVLHYKKCLTDDDKYKCPNINER